MPVRPWEAVREWLFFSLSRRIYPPAWKLYGLEAEPEAQSLRLPRSSGRWYWGQAQIIILEILQCIPACPIGPEDRTGVVIIFAFLDLGKNISFSDSLL